MSKVIDKQVWGGCQSPHIFDESSARWIASNKKYKVASFYLADADHVGTLSNVDGRVMKYDLEDYYSAIYHYFPFFGRLSRIKIDQFIETYSLPKKLCRSVLSEIDTDKYKRDKFYLMPPYEKEDTLKSIDKSVCNQGLLNELSFEAIAEIQNHIVDDGQQERLDNISRCIPEKSNSMIDFSNNQYKNLSELLGLDIDLQIGSMSDYFCKNRNRIISMIMDFIKKYDENVSRYNREIAAYGLPYKNLLKKNGDLPFIRIDCTTLKRSPLTIDNFDPNEGQYFYVGRHAFLIASFSSISPNGSLYLSGVENTAYHRLTEMASVSSGIDPSLTRIKYQKSLFFDFLNKLDDKIKTPEWLHSYVKPVETLSVFVKKIENLINRAADQLEKSGSLNGIDEVISYFCERNDIDKYYEQKDYIKSLGNSDNKRLVWEKFWGCRNDLLKQSFLHWTELNNHLLLSRFKSRGSHLVWLYVFSGKDAALEYISLVEKDLL